MGVWTGEGGSQGQLLVRGCQWALPPFDMSRSVRDRAGASTRDLTPGALNGDPAEGEEGEGERQRERGLVDRLGPAHAHMRGGP